MQPSIAYCSGRLRLHILYCIVVACVLFNLLWCPIFSWVQNKTSAVTAHRKMLSPYPFWLFLLCFASVFFTTAWDNTCNPDCTVNPVTLRWHIQTNSWKESWLCLLDRAVEGETNQQNQFLLLCARKSRRSIVRYIQQATCVLFSHQTIWNWLHVVGCGSQGPTSFSMSFAHSPALHSCCSCNFPDNTRIDRSAMGNHYLHRFERFTLSTCEIVWRHHGEH